MKCRHRYVQARFFGDGVLSFGAKAQFAGMRLHAVPLVRGALTVMEGYAADSVTHAVLSSVGAVVA